MQPSPPEGGVEAGLSGCGKKLSGCQALGAGSQRVLISLRIASFLPEGHWVGKKSRGKEGEKKGRGRARQGGDGDSASP